MFAKLLKHEWRATKGVIALLCVIILISGATIGSVMMYMMRAEQSGPLVVMNEAGSASASAPMSTVVSVLCGLLLMAGVIAVAVCCAGSLFFLIWRFYKRCFTDEGYLTFTLPVTNHQILLSSIVNTVIGFALVVLAAFGAIAIASCMCLLAFPETLVWADVVMSAREVLGQMWESIVKNAGEFALVGFSAIMGSLGELIVLMLAVTIGALIAKKHRILAAVGVYYGISMAQSIVYSFTALSTAFRGDVDTLLSIPGIMGLLTAAGGYFLIHYLVSRKLNLT